MSFVNESERFALLEKSCVVAAVVTAHTPPGEHLHPAGGEEQQRRLVKSLGQSGLCHVVRCQAS